MAWPSPCSKIFGNGVTTILYDNDLEAVKYIYIFLNCSTRNLDNTKKLVGQKFTTIVREKIFHAEL